MKNLVHDNVNAKVTWHKRDNVFFSSYRDPVSDTVKTKHLPKSLNLLSSDVDKARDWFKNWEKNLNTNSIKTEPLYLVGDCKVYSEAEDAALEIMELFGNTYCLPLLIAQMQQGKTTVCNAVLNKFLDERELDKEPFQVIIITTLPDNSLKEQTDDRFSTGHEGSDLQGRCNLLGGEDSLIIKHSANLSNLSLKKNVKHRLFFIDELHSHMTKNGRVNTFLKEKCGISICENPEVWNENGVKNYLLGVSATPFAAHIRAELDGIFEPVLLKESASYLSPKKAMDRNRFYDADYLVKKNEDGFIEVTDFAKTSIAKWLKDFSNPCTYLKCRVIGQENVDVFVNYLKCNNIPYKEFSSSAIELSKLDKLLNSKYPPARPTVIVIRGGLRAGKSVNTQHLGGMIDSPGSGNVDSANQGFAGRAMGHNKLQDKFPIYCNLKAVNEYIEWIEGLKSGNIKGIPKSNHTRKTYLKRKCYETDWVSIEQANALKNQTNPIVNGKEIYPFKGCTTVSNRPENLLNILNKSLPSGSTKAIVFDNIPLNSQTDRGREWTQQDILNWNKVNVIHSSKIDHVMVFYKNHNVSNGVKETDIKETSAFSVVNP